MKLKRILFFFTALVLMFSLCSCTKLDELREKHVRYSQESTDILEYQGNTYHRIETGDEMYWPGRDYGSISGQLTEHDVPVLLSQIFQKGFVKISKNKATIYVVNNDPMFYLRSDLYEEYLKSTFSEYFSFYSVFDYKKDEIKILSPECKEVIEATVKGNKTDEEIGDQEFMYPVSLCDKTGEIALEFGNLFKTVKGEYFIETYNGQRYKVLEVYTPILSDFLTGGTKKQVE